MGNGFIMNKFSVVLGVTAELISLHHGEDDDDDGDEVGMDDSQNKYILPFRSLSLLFLHFVVLLLGSIHSQIFVFIKEPV